MAGKNSPSERKEEGLSWPTVETKLTKSQDLQQYTWNPTYSNSSTQTASNFEASDKYGTYHDEVHASKENWNSFMEQYLP